MQLREGTDMPSHGKVQWVVMLQVIEQVRGNVMGIRYQISSTECHGGRGACNTNSPKEVSGRYLAQDLALSSNSTGHQEIQIPGS